MYYTFPFLLPSRSPKPSQPLSHQHHYYIYYICQFSPLRVNVSALGLVGFLTVATLLQFWWPWVVPRPHVGGTVVIWPKPLYWRWSCLFQTCHPSWWLSPPAVDSNASLSSRLESLLRSSLNFLCCYFMACCQLMRRVIYYLPLTGFNLMLGQQ